MNPARIGFVAKTSAPVPVSSVKRVASSSDVSIEVEDTLLLKSDQSLVERKPRFADEAVGALKVMVFPLPVMVKSEPVVEVAKTMVGPVCVCPVGPIAVTKPSDEVAVSV
jgi:hypothetical protein